MKYHIYQLVGNLWVRKSGHAMTYAEGKEAERPYHAAGLAARLFNADAPAEILYSPDGAA